MKRCKEESKIYHSVEELRWRGERERLVGWFTSLVDEKWLAGIIPLINLPRFLRASNKRGGTEAPLLFTSTISSHVSTPVLRRSVY